jgi:rare lipoprotein A
LQSDQERVPFVGERIIDLSEGAAKRLGYFKKGTARVLVEIVKLET